VEEPNGFLFLKPALDVRERVSIPVPSISEEKCTACGTCVEWCQFNALAAVNNKVIKFPQLCHGCGLCSLVCPKKAVREVPREIGIIETGTFNNSVFLQGILNTGEPLAVPIIKRLVSGINKITAQHVVIDCPPGSSCSVIAAVENSDCCLLVTEPTPFGLHDLAIAVELIRSMNIPAGVIINKADKQSRMIKDYCTAQDIPVLLEIPFSKSIAAAYSRGEMITENNEVLENSFKSLGIQLEALINESSCYS
jgi:MinD superfamily P-loop ATPase